MTPVRYCIVGETGGSILAQPRLMNYGNAAGRFQYSLAVGTLVLQYSSSKDNNSTI